MADKLDFDPDTKTLYGRGKNKFVFGMLIQTTDGGDWGRIKAANDTIQAFKKCEELHSLKLKEPVIFGPYHDKDHGW